MVRPEFADWVPYRVPSKPLYDLGNNENRVMDWSFLAQETMTRLSPADVTFYGDNSYGELRQAYGNYLGVDPDWLVAGVGSDHLIHMIVTTFLTSQDVFLGVDPDFFMYRVYNQLHGSRFVSHPLEWEEGSLQLSVEGLLEQAAAVNAKLIMLSNPNNPASIAYPLEQLEELARRFDGLLVIDEAYIEFAAVESFLSRLPAYDNVILLRTLSKAFGLAGLRLGFAVSTPALTHELNKVMPPFSLSNVAAKMGSVAMDHLDQIQSSVQTIQQLREDCLSFLRSLPDCQVLPSQASFVTFTAPWAQDFHQVAAQAGWHFKYYPTGILAGFIRLSMGRKEEMAAFQTLLLDYLKAHSFLY